MVLTVTEDTPADMLAGSMELLVQLPREHHLQTQRVTVQRSTPMMDLLVQIATAHKLAASSYTLQAIGERGMVLPHQPNTPIGALDALQVKLLPKQGTLVPRKTKQSNQPFETTFRLQVHLPRNQLYVSRVSPKMNLGEILDEVCREKNLDKNKYELRHPSSLETLDLSLSLQDYHLQEVTLYAKQGRTLGSALSTQDIMALQRQEERRRQQAKQGVFGFVFKKSKESSLSTDSLGGRSASPARSDETGRSTSPLQLPARPQRKRRPAPKPPMQPQAEVSNSTDENSGDSSKDKVVISHSRNSSDSSGYHEASVLSDNPDSAGRLPETLPRRNKTPLEMPRKLAQTSQSSKSLCNLASVPGTLSHGISSTSLSSTGLRKKRAAPPPPVTRPLSSAISTQALERIVDSEESLTSDMDPSKPPSDIGAPSKANSDIEERPKASSDIGVTTFGTKLSSSIDFTKPDTMKSETESKNDKVDLEPRHRSGSVNVKLASMEQRHPAPVEDAPVDARAQQKRVGEPVPLPKPRKVSTIRPEVPKRRLTPSPLSRTLSSDSSNVDRLSNAPARSETRSLLYDASSSIADSERGSVRSEEKLEVISCCSTSEDEIFFTSGVDTKQATFDYDSIVSEKSVLASKDKNEDNLNPVQKKIDEKLHVDEDEENAKVSLNRNTTLPGKVYDSVSEVPEGRNLKISSSYLAEKSEDQNNSTLPKGKQSSTNKLEEPKSSDISSSPTLSNKSASGQEKKLCAVISTMPKCDHLDALVVDNTIIQNKERFAKKAKIPRTASKSNDFEVNSLEKQKRHLTAHTEDITFALNLNVASNVSLPNDQSKGDLEERSKEDFEEHLNTSQGVGEAQSLSDTNFSETDVLLQKVSDTLSNSLPTPKEIPVSIEAELETTVPKEISEKNKKNTFVANTSTPNLTVNSQQDTSDYVSAADEDLSVAEWEYQLPAPSAFRDSSSPVFDDVETVTPEFFADSQPAEKNQKKKLEKQISEGALEEKPVKLYRSELSLKKEVISELENKIGTLPQSAKDVDNRRTVSNPSTPKIAPVDNTLSNFTITTYSGQKSLNIFEEVEQQSSAKDERFIKSFATLSRNRINENEDKTVNELSVGTLQMKKKVEEEPKIKTETLQRWQYGNEKSNIQRSKSHVSVCEKPNLQAKTCEKEILKRYDEEGMEKATSVNNLSATMPKSNEKFSQWRENILKRQENPTKEKQLQSLQVLKSILPQLKNTQQAEENVPKENDGVLPEKTRSVATSNEHSIDSNVLSSREPKPAATIKKIEEKNPSTETNKKRYTYSGPPTINLGSWSERPTVNVQIKMDTDYKFGPKQTNNKTIININGSKDEADAPSNIENSKNEDRREPNDLTRKLINHTTASGFKKPVLKKINPSEPKNEDKAVVTAVELKKNFLKQEDNVIDTTPVNFKELTKAFGQDVCLRPKPKRSNTIHNDSSKQNGYVNSDKSSINSFQENAKPKFTSVVGIQSQNSFAFRNGVKGNPMPVVKGFKTYVETKEEQSKDASNQPPKPPTMPVITGVTLKSARPKSMPVQMDRRDVLLEAIRNFGGRENLKSVSTLT